MTFTPPADRLNITPTPPREKRRHVVPMSEPLPKRARLHHEEQSVTSASAAGFIQISDVEPTGKFVQIKNMSSQVGTHTTAVWMWLKKKMMLNEMF